MTPLEYELLNEEQLINLALIQLQRIDNPTHGITVVIRFLTGRRSVIRKHLYQNAFSCCEEFTEQPPEQSTGEAP